MKHSHILAFAAVLAAVFVSCKKPDPVVPATLSLTPSAATVPAEGGKVNVTIKSNTAWTVTTTVTWLHAEVSNGRDDGSFKVVADPSDGLTSREGKVQIGYAGKNAVLTITQATAAPKGPFSGGDGTPANPYQIATADDLFNLGASTSGGKYLDCAFVQTADIDMDGKNMQPIAQNVSAPFTGSYDGQLHKVSNVSISSTAPLAAGFVAYAENATLKNIIFEDVAITSKYTYCGGIAGYITSTTVENCRISGGKVQAYETGLNVENVANAGFSGGIVGHASKSTIKGCIMDCSASFYGQYSGGVVGDAANCTIDGCMVPVDRAVNVYYHNNGGIVARVTGSDSVVKNCVFEGNLTSCGNTQGGIVGSLQGGEVVDCVMGGHGVIGADKYYVGGIVGLAKGNSKITSCAVYGSVSGQYSVGGIVGLMQGATVSKCASIGAKITGTGNNGGSNLYSLVSGIAGWTHSNANTISNCLANPELIQTISNGNRGALAGISGYQNSTANVVYENCVSLLDANKILNCGDILSMVTGTFFHGAIYARATQPLMLTNCFYDSTVQCGPQEGKTIEVSCEALTPAQLNDAATVTKLNNYAKENIWAIGPDNIITLTCVPADPNPVTKGKKRVSIIGDSISTFRGWVPSGYSTHYPATDGTLTTVNETYWYRLINDFMKNAQFETNIAFSGSTVTNTTKENYEKRYGTATNAWWHNSYTERFAACGGMGRPDIIIIHGGTNDWSHNADPLAPGVAIRNDASNAYGGSAPEDALMNALFATADAAKTRTQINALPDGTFCEAYIKLMCQIRERYPQCKVVCIVGDYLNSAIEQSTIQIAEHYGARVVNLFRVNGFNDLGGYSPETLSNKGTQPNMPKHDYSGDVGGCHPGSKAMEFIANKIYTELGTWLEN